MSTIASFSRVSRRTLLGLAAGAGLALTGPANAAGPAVRVSRSPGCKCCGRWAALLGQAGYSVEIVEPDDLGALRARLGVPDDLAACHVAEVEGYVLEGHVPLDAIERLLKSRPAATGLAVPGMPLGSPGMESDDPAEAYEVILFGPAGRSSFGRYRGGEPV